MSDALTDRLNKILPRVVADDFLGGSEIGNEIAFYVFDYPPEDELNWGGAAPLRRRNAKRSNPLDRQAAGLTLFPPPGSVLQAHR